MLLQLSNNGKKTTSGKSFFLDNSGFGLNYTNNLRKLIQMLNLGSTYLANQDGARRAIFYATNLQRNVWC